MSACMTSSAPGVWKACAKRHPNGWAVKTSPDANRESRWNARCADDRGALRPRHQAPSPAAAPSRGRGFSGAEGLRESSSGCSSASRRLATSASSRAAPLGSFRGSNCMFCARLNSRMVGLSARPTRSSIRCSITTSASSMAISSEPRYDSSSASCPTHTIVLHSLAPLRRRSDARLALPRTAPRFVSPSRSRASATSWAGTFGHNTTIGMSNGRYPARLCRTKLTAEDQDLWASSSTKGASMARARMSAARMASVDTSWPEIGSESLDSTEPRLPSGWLTRLDRLAELPPLAVLRLRSCPLPSSGTGRDARSAASRAVRALSESLSSFLLEDGLLATTGSSRTSCVPWPAQATPPGLSCRGKRLSRAEVRRDGWLAAEGGLGKQQLAKPGCGLPTSAGGSAPSATANTSSRPSNSLAINPHESRS
mmetsp:Transcript_52701/g.140419  ORF Transcript_52701/g.140419 Transcript_52701/m.140419 type:complete len:426 (-) Transcript_52701:1252-2529(-)